MLFLNSVVCSIKYCVAATISLFVLLIATIASASDFNQTVMERQLPIDVSSNELRLRFFGTSSFLLEDDKTQIVIDGFFTRFPHKLVRKFRPSEEQIFDIINRANICPNSQRRLDPTVPEACNNGRAKHLAYIIPTHGHYDHALDAPYLAAWSGAKLISYPAVQSIAKASKQYMTFSNQFLDWEGYEEVPVFESETTSKEVLQDAGNFKISLVKTPHNKNPSSPFLSGTTTPEFSFPATIWKMKEGVTFSVLVEHHGRRMLFVPSAGEIGDIFVQNEVKADVVFLGIGGLGFKSRHSRRELWKDTVTKVGAERVIPIHWDNDQYSYPEKLNENFKSSPFRRPSFALKTFDRLAGNDVEIVFAPAIEQFDPFGLNAK